MAQIEVKVKLDLPAGVELLGYERCGEGHGFEVKFPLPLSCRCEKCRTEEPARYEYKNTVYVVRDLDLWGQAYAVEKAKIESRRRGHYVTEQTLADGSIKLTIQVNGGAA